MNKTVAGLLVLALAVGACSPAPPPQGVAPAAPDGADAADGSQTGLELLDVTKPIDLVFWRQSFREDSAEALQQHFIDSFMNKHPNIKVDVKKFDYNKLYFNTLASIQADTPPDLVVAYETWASEYYEAGALEPLERYIGSEHHGLPKGDLADFVPSFMEATIFPQYNKKRLTFPYTKSDLLLYTNLDVLRALGLDRPAATWEEFVAHCGRAVASGRLCWALQKDASIFAGIVFSYGGKLVSEYGDRSELEGPTTRQALTLYTRLVRERLGYLDREGANLEHFLTGRSLYHLGSSSHIPRLTDGFRQRDGRRIPGFQSSRSWEVSLIPQGTATQSQKATVLFGGNLSILKPRKDAKVMRPDQAERQLAAWLLIKHLTSPANTARWGFDQSNGYFPVRLSALQQPDAIGLKDNRQFAAAFEIGQSFARPEPSAVGWQEVRYLIEDTLADLFAGKITGDQAVDQAHRRIAQGAARILSQQ